MKILIIASWYQNDTNQIRGSFFREQALALVKAGHEVTLISVEQLATSPKSFKKHGAFVTYDDNGIRTIIYHQMSFGSNTHSIGLGEWRINYDTFFSHNLKGYQKLYHRLKVEGYSCDIIHAHSFYPGGYAACVLKDIFDVPVIITEHCSIIPANKLTSKGKDALEYTVNTSDGFYCVSQGLIRSVYETLSDRKLNKSIGLIPNILSNLFFSNPLAEKKHEYTFISTGQLIKRKRMNLLIEAFTNAFQNRDDTRLIIYGEGEERLTLEKMVQERHMQEYIKLPGRVSREELAKEMQRCHAFVLPSALETFGVVYIEAMACGLPAIGTLNGGSNEIVNDYGGVPIPVDDVPSLERALRLVRLNEYHFDPERISTGIVSKYGGSTILALLENAYKSQGVLI